MNKSYSLLWAKTHKSNASWHPLVLHLLDVAASAEAILQREPEKTRQRMGEVVGLPWKDAKSWLLLLIACHDLGKACPGFQMKWDGAKELLSKSDLTIPQNPDTDIHHAFVSQITLSAILQLQDWKSELAELSADAVGCHHGARAGFLTLDRLGGNRRALGGSDWEKTRHEIFEALRNVLKPTKPPIKDTLSGPDFMLLSGLTSFADWIGSNEEYFSFGVPEDCEDLGRWCAERRKLAERALDGIDWQRREPLVKNRRSLADVFNYIPDFAPRPLQEAVAERVQSIDQPCVLLLEAPMGEGKTEAAFYAHLELQRKLGHRGLYVALPTKATGNAMFKRSLEFLRSLAPGRHLDLQLVHGAAQLNDAFQNIRFSQMYNSEGKEQVGAAEWFTYKKRALLSEYGVGTVDQALLPILPVRHHFVRLWGLANRVVIFDEIHAYDAYTGTLLVHLLRWLLALGSSVVLLSATLPPSIRRKLAEVADANPPKDEAAYPRLSVFRKGGVDQVHFEADPSRRRIVRLHGVTADLPSLKGALGDHLVQSGMGLALVNTVQRAQELYKLFPDGQPLERDGMRIGKRLHDGTEIILFHARFPADQRQRREDAALAMFGMAGTREGRKVLIATQVAEQSLDLDFDVIATDLAPIDLVLQRAGRLWRHARNTRPVAEPVMLVAGLTGDEPPVFGKPLWWDKVYRADILLYTWNLLRRRQNLTLPDEIDGLVQAVYEEQVEVPESQRDRMDKALAVEGKAIADRGQANEAIMGLPDDASWNRPERFVLYDEDEPGVHRSLMAQTRLGQDSVVAIPLFSADGFCPEAEPNFAQAKEWILRAVSISRKDVVQNLRAAGVPESWKKSKKSSLLRNCFPLPLDAQGRWVKDRFVRLDDDLGLVYEPKEAM